MTHADDTAPCPGGGTLWLDASAPLGLVDVEDEHNRRFTVTGERTACPHLRITPCWDVTGRLLGTWRLTHVPTGLRVPGTDGLTPDQLRVIAREVADVDAWASRDRGALNRTATFLAARVAMAREVALR